jgi:hypothetical protein
MIRRALRSMAGFLVLALAIGGVAAESSDTFDKIVDEYEKIRVALLHDTLEGVSEPALEIVRLLNAMGVEPDAATAGIAADKTGAFHKLLPPLQASAVRIGKGDSIESVREAFGDLSKSMVMYRQMTAAPEAVVVFCSMAGKAWLQPKGEIGNPYYGQGMARCGEVVSQ